MIAVELLAVEVNCKVPVIAAVLDQPVSVPAVNDPASVGFAVCAAVVASAARVPSAKFAKASAKSVSLTTPVAVKVRPAIVTD